MIPDKSNEAIPLFGQRQAAGSSNPAALGMTPGGMAAPSPLIASARGASTAADARQASKNATVTLQGNSDSLRSKGSAIVAKIKAFAESTGNPNVDVLASIPPPVPPATLSAFVNNDGNAGVKE